VSPDDAGKPGGAYPYWVAIKGLNKAYVSSQRDQEIVISDIGSQPAVKGRIALSGAPNRMILNRAQDLLFVSLANADAVAVIDTATDKEIARFSTTFPMGLFPGGKRYLGNNPNSLALSPREDALYVTNGGTNSLAVIELRRQEGRVEGRLSGMIPTGYYPNSVSVSAGGDRLYIANGKSNTGPNPDGCRDSTSIASGATNNCNAANQYSPQLSKAGLLSLPLPGRADLLDLSRQTAYNCNYQTLVDYLQNQELMDTVRQQVKHVIYVVKENRTYDQVLGDMPAGNGDPSLAILAPFSPNHHRLAGQFALLDNFHDSASVSGDGWNWSTSARATDYTEKTVPLNYASRGFTYDYEGANRNVPLGLAKLEERLAAMPGYPNDPDLLPGTNDVAAPDGPDGEQGAGYLWDAAMRAGLIVRNYGFFVGNATVPDSQVDRFRKPFENRDVQSLPLKAALRDNTDYYYRGFDQRNSDFWLLKEWEREFDAFVANGNLPHLSLVRLPHDHFGDFTLALDGVSTVETQMADNDYAIGKLVEKLARSPYRDDTLVVIVEDDAQNGGDHMDAHRSLALFAGPFVRQGALVSRYYTTVNLLRTMIDVLGLEPMGLNDALAEPMAEVFDPWASQWDYTEVVPDALRTTKLPLPPPTAASAQTMPAGLGHLAMPRRTPEYWRQAMAGQSFEKEDTLDPDAFNRALWQGLAGEEAPYPEVRHGRDLRANRAEMLTRWREEQRRQPGAGRDTSK
jgi:DNA-binding beta-propeller fold protein YncE